MDNGNIVRFGSFDADPNGFELKTELRVAESPNQVFDFFADAFQLESITPDWLHFSVESSRPISMGSGTSIDYRLRLHGLPIRWRSSISIWEPPHRFVDEQVRGPYRFWRHEHTFEPYSGGTIVRDAVRYGVPLGWLIHPLFVKRDLRRIFEYRHHRVANTFTPVDRHVGFGMA